jgi:hypothetical protein
MKNINLHFDGEVTIDGINIIDRYAERHMSMMFHYDWYSITQDVVENYLQSLCDHVMNVRSAGHIIGVNPQQMIDHDSSKFSLSEFPYYARNFQGDKGDIDGFARAWLHHIHVNEHHWQHWLFPDNFAPKGSTVESGAVWMDECWIKEMVADWMGANLTYQRTMDMSEWLTKNLPKIKLNSNSWPTLKGVLRDHGKEYGYHSILNELQANGLIP